MIVLAVDNDDDEEEVVVDDVNGHDDIVLIFDFVDSFGRKGGRSFVTRARSYVQ